GSSRARTASVSTISSAGPRFHQSTDRIEVMAATGTNGSGPRRRKQRGKQEVCDAAARVFHEKGYGSSSIQDIADGVGILKGSLYYYIDSKEDLLYEILRRVNEEAFQQFEYAVAAETATMAKLRAFVVALFTFHTENLVRIG